MDFSALTAYLDSIPALGVPGCDLIVCRDHETLYRHMAGYRDENLKEPLRGNETYNLYSATKVFTTCAAMQLIENGKMSLDDPVKNYLPSFAHLTVKDGDTVRPAQKVMTVRHLMSMQSGLNYDLDTPAIRRVLKETDNQATTRQLVDAKAEDPLEFEPGENFLYSASHDALAAVIEVASGERFSDYLRRHICDPLGIQSMFFILPKAWHDRQSVQVVFNPETGAFDVMPREDLNYRLCPNYESGGAGLIGTTEDYALFVDALACGGKTKDGYQLLSPQMIQLWSANQLGPVSRKSFDAWKRLGYSYALGVRTRVEQDLGGRGQIGEFGWDGAAGAWAMIDPHHRLSAFYASHVRNYGYNYDVIHPTVRDLIYKALY